MATTKRKESLCNVFMNNLNMTHHPRNYENRDWNEQSWENHKNWCSYIFCFLPVMLLKFENTIFYAYLIETKTEKIQSVHHI